MLEKLIAIMKSNIPGFDIRYKKDSIIQRIIGWIFGLINIDYMDDFITVFYPYVYLPGDRGLSDNRKDFAILAHEYIHLMDTKNSPIWFRFSYLMPQILGLVLPFASLLSIWFSNLWLLSLIFVIFVILPLPSYWRAKWEFRAYAMSMAVNIWTERFELSKFKKNVIKHFTGNCYFFMWPFRVMVLKKLNEIEDMIHDGRIFDCGNTFKDVFVLIREHKTNNKE